MQLQHLHHNTVVPPRDEQATCYYCALNQQRWYFYVERQTALMTMILTLQRRPADGADDDVDCGDGGSSER